MTASNKIEYIKQFGENCVHYGAQREDGKRVELERHKLEQGEVCKAREGDFVEKDKQNGKGEPEQWTPSFEAVLRVVGTASVTPNNVAAMSNELWAAMVADRTALLIAKLRERKLL